jgi:Spy/CpxP family protein refolding chaperone
MLKVTRSLATVAAAAALFLGVSQGLAQQDNNQGNNGGNRGGGGGGGRGGNFDPAQRQQRMMEFTREELEVKDDAEWKALEPLVQKVMEIRRESFSGMGRAMFGRGRGGGGGGGGGGADQGNRRGGPFGQPSPEAETLQRAIESKASTAELKAALAKYVESRKAKQVELEKAQAELRKVLTVRQEAIATANGLL